MYEIEKGVPIPVKKSGAGMGPFSQTAEALDVGDSFVCDYVAKCSTAQGLLQHIRRKHPKRSFTTRKVEGGVRVWRIA